MVHALREVKRLLRKSGAMIDLRPISDDWSVDVISARETRSAGMVSALPEDRESDAASNRAVETAAEEGWFERQHGEFFSFRYYWDSPSELQEYVEAEWADWVVIPDDLWPTIRSVWAVADADARLRIEMKMLITHWQKLD
jgi:hypothetical protein